MSTRMLLAALAVLTLVSVIYWPEATAYERYNDGCETCHGAFTDDTSTKGSVFPAGDKHDMHANSEEMGAACDLCHSRQDGNNPYIGSSDGTSNNDGLGCNGCHEPVGMRAHHQVNAVTSCAFCHPGDPIPPTEDTVPPYYGTGDTNASGPCNDIASGRTNENWTVGDFLGSDNDGDGLYDGADPDCGAVTSTPGEVLGLLVTAHDRTTGRLTIGYDNGVCAVSENNLYAGDLSQVASYAYDSQVCGIGNDGSYVWTYPETGSLFFVVVGRDAAVEGSYGRGEGSGERPEAARCPEAQDLSNRCD